ncbi:Cyclin-dependent kinases regulatory subunit (Cell division control protein cks1) [Coniothyrium glycines]
MAAPASIDIKNLEGKWVMNKGVSDAFDPVLVLQGMGWLTRKALGAATVTQLLRQSSTTGEDGQPTTEIKMDQVLTGGLKGSSEVRILDWHYRSHTDSIFGTVQGRSRYNTLAKIVEESKGKGETEEDAKFLTEGWLKETEEGEVVESYVENESSKWTAWQIWGFADIGSARKLTRKFVVKRTDKEDFTRVRLVYDYTGDLA